MDKIRVGIVGYGNLGKGAELALKYNPDFQLVGIFTRRDISNIDSNSNIIHISKILEYQDKIDVMILCGGSAKDLPEQGPSLAKFFNTIDSYDNHANIPKYFETMDKVAKESGKVSLISAGWDPGLFSMNRLLGQTIFPKGNSYTFWGKGVSQGHSDAIKRIEGVKNAIQYTIPSEEAMDKVRAGKTPKLTNGDKHKRVCYVVPCDIKDKDRIEKEIKSMPNYFLEYDTTVHFITEEELKKNHSKMPHGGFVISTDINGNNHKQRMEFSLELESNPEFASTVLITFARAVYRLSQEGKKGAFTVFDIPLAYLSPKSGEDLRKEFL